MDQAFRDAFGGPALVSPPLTSDVDVSGDGRTALPTPQVAPGPAGGGRGSKGREEGWTSIF